MKRHRVTYKDETSKKLAQAMIPENINQIKETDSSIETQQN